MNFSEMWSLKETGFLSQPVRMLTYQHEKENLCAFVHIIAHEKEAACGVQCWSVHHRDSDFFKSIKSFDEDEWE
jgi:hypothetical protein